MEILLIVAGKKIIKLKKAARVLCDINFDIIGTFHVLNSNIHWTHRSVKSHK